MVTKMEHFLEASMGNYPDFCFKSPSKDRGNLHVESIPISIKQTPIMSPIPNKYKIEFAEEREKTQVKKIKEELKFTPLKDITNSSRLNLNSADKAASKLRQVDDNVERISQNKDKMGPKQEIDYILGKMSQSAGKPKKSVSKVEKYINKEKEIKRSPLIPDRKLETSLLSPESSRYDPHQIHDSGAMPRSSRLSNRAFSPRKALDFADKSQFYKGRNLFEDNYQ